MSDRFIEVYAGKYGRSSLHINTKGALKVENLTDAQMKLYLGKTRDFLVAELPTLINPKDTDLLNLRDELLGDINQCVYLFDLE